MADQPTFSRYHKIAPDKMTAEPGTGITTEHNDSSLASVMSTAERELGAFITAVSDLYGPEQARISAEDWLDELNSMNALPKSTTRAWRLITIAAATRLASRLNEMGCLRTPEVCACKEETPAASG